MSSGSVSCVLSAVTFLALEQRVNTKFYFKLGKTPTKLYEMLQLSVMMKPEVVAMYLNGLNDLKTGV
jgi:hypothetical protein